MSSARATSLGTALVVAGVLAGCSDLYLDRRDKVSLSAGDAVAANKLTQMVDPWPRHASNRNIAFNGERMQTAIERYRTDRVTAPVNATTSSSQYQRVAPVVLSTGGGKP